MNRQSVRSALVRSARGVLPATAGPASAPFSTTSPQAILKNIPGRQGRLAAAASEVSSLNNEENAGAHTSASTTTASSGPLSNPHFSRAAPSRDGGDDSGAQPRTKILNLRSLPRSGMSGAFGSRFPGPSGVSTPTPRFSRTGTPNPAFKPNPAFQSGDGGGREEGGRFGGDRFGGNRFGGPGQSERLGGGGRLRRPRRRDDRRKRDDNGPAVDSEEYPNKVIRDYMESLVVGTPVVYEPALTLEGLLGYGPAVASSQANSGGRGPVSSALRSMRVMADGYAFAGAQEEGATVTTALHNPRLLIERLHEGKAVFFDTADERAMVDKALHSNKVLAHLKKRKLPEDTTMIAPAPEAAKEAIMDAAVRGVYESKAPKATVAPAGSLLETYHRYQSLSYTYTEQQAASFGKKILELLPQAAGKANAAKGGKGSKARAAA
ncbi:hypothetical protein SCUCBS95973_002492 [Sporothrix curviconia]|uniref:Uncharacterized protein n=1 Tax=Sporothrix curviconia TaxID=1260050 RepID=A0ABP0B7D0_9PEZI